MWANAITACATADVPDVQLDNGDAGLASLLHRIDPGAGEMFREVHGRLLDEINTTFPLATRAMAREIGAHGGPACAVLLILTLHAYAADLHDDEELRKRVMLAAQSAEYLAVFPIVLAGLAARPSDAAEKASNALIILIADFALSRSLLAGAELGPQVAAELGRVAREACEGGQMDSVDRYDADRPVARYLSAVERRVGSAFGFAAALGAELAGVPGGVIEHVRRCGCELGVAYQIAEDIRALAPSAETTEEIAAALRQGRYPLPLLLRARSDRHARATLKKSLASGDLTRITDQIRIKSALTHAQEILERRILSAQVALRSARLERPENLGDFGEWIRRRPGEAGDASSRGDPRSCLVRRTVSEVP